MENSYSLAAAFISFQQNSIKVISHDVCVFVCVYVCSNSHTIHVSASLISTLCSETFWAHLYLYTLNPFAIVSI